MDGEHNDDSRIEDNGRFKLKKDKRAVIGDGK
jgi:hypothetical protein